MAYFLNECTEGSLYLWEIDEHDILDPYALSLQMRICVIKRKI